MNCSGVNLMEHEIGKSSALISSCLEETKFNLQNGDVAASDAIIVCLRVSRMFFGDTRLEPMVRELLGYSASETTTAMEYLRNVDPDEDHRLWPGGPPNHRLLRGYRVPIFVALGQACKQERVGVNKDVLFCDLSAGELEAIVGRALADRTPYLVMGYEEETSTAFILKTAELSGVLTGLSERVCKFIDELLGDLAQAPNVPLCGGDQPARAA
jgi:hypothetical protein